MWGKVSRFSRSYRLMNAYERVSTRPSKLSNQDFSATFDSYYTSCWLISTLNHMWTSPRRSTWSINYICQLHQSPVTVQKNLKVGTRYLVAGRLRNLSKCPRAKNWHVFQGSMHHSNSLRLICESSNSATSLDTTREMAGSEPVRRSGGLVWMPRDLSILSRLIFQSQLTSLWQSRCIW